MEALKHILVPIDFGDAASNPPSVRAGTSIACLLHNNHESLGGGP